MKRALAAVGAGLLVAALGFGLALYRDGLRHRGMVLPGVSIATIPVGGLTPRQARATVDAIVAARLARTLAIETGGSSIRPTRVQLGVRAETAAAVAAAYGLGREASLPERLQTRWRLRRGADIPLRHTQDERLLRQVVARLAASVASEPRDARVTVIDDAVVLTEPSAEGQALDVEETVIRVRDAIAREAAAVAAAVRVTAPRLTTEQALAMTTPLGRYTTRFVNIPNRNHNIALAASKLRGVLLLPGKVFSFNETVGPRTPELGYLPAPVLLNNVLVPGDGGGVCQVSSTLFNVALLADLAIVERYNHTRPVAYLPIGRDATVVYGGQNLRFQNTTGHPLLLWSGVRGRRLTITIYGPGTAAQEVAIVVGERTEISPPGRTITRDDPELPVGQTVIDPPKPGYRVRTYRAIVRDGVVLRREQIAFSVYTPLPRTIRIGAKPEPVAPAAAR